MITIFKEDGLSDISRIRHVMRKSGNHCSREACCGETYRNQGAGIGTVSRISWRSSTMPDQTRISGTERMLKGDAGTATDAARPSSKDGLAVRKNSG